LPGDKSSFAAKLVGELDRDTGRQGLRQGDSPPDVGPARFLTHGFLLSAKLVGGLDRDTGRQGLRQGDSPILRVRKIGTVPERAENWGCPRARGPLITSAQYLQMSVRKPDCLTLARQGSKLKVEALRSAAITPS